VAALAHAGALLTYQAATATREQTLELLPCLTVQVRARARARARARVSRRSSCCPASPSRYPYP
jgi:hypothetical protein